MSFWDRVRAIEAKLDSVSYYELLGVSPKSSAEEISSRYYALAAKLHPDRYVARAAKDELATLNRIHARMGEAKGVLLSAEKRAEYDRGLAKGTMRLEDTSESPRKLSQRDPALPTARALYEKAMAEIASGAKGQAKANLKLAKQYEPGSAAIAEALASLEDTKTPPPPPSEPAPPPPPAAEPSRRIHERSTAALPVRLRIPTWERFEMLYTRDISSGGMFLKSSKAIPIGTKLNLNLLMPSGETVELEATVVHIREAAPGRPSGMGLRFGEVPEATQQTLASIMAGIAKPKPEDGPLSIEELVSELVRIRDLPAHEQLGIANDAGREEARLAYETLTRRYHPHRNNATNDPAFFDICRELIGCVRHAYEVVSAAS